MKEAMKDMEVEMHRSFMEAMGLDREQEVTSKAVLMCP